MKLSSLPIRTELAWALALLLVACACWWPLRQISRLALSQTALEQQFTQVQALAAQAQQLQSVAQPPGGDAAVLLQAAVAKEWGSAATLVIQGDAAVLTLQKAAAASLAPGLDRLRQDARAVFTASKWTVQGDSVSGTVNILLPGAP